MSSEEIKATYASARTANAARTYQPTQNLSESGKTGPATVIISAPILTGLLFGVPGVISTFTYILTGLLFGVPGVIGLLIGGLSSGFVLAIFMANAGGAWDNAKKFVEEGNFGGKGSEVHRATVVGDTVGDPFKDTSGPSLNILIKLMSMVAIVMAGLTVSWSLF